MDFSYSTQNFIEIDTSHLANSILKTIILTNLKSE